MTLLPDLPVSLIPSKPSKSKIRMSNPQPQCVSLRSPMNDTTLVTEVFSSALRPTSPPHDTIMLSLGELAIMFQSEGFAPKVADTFVDDPHLSMMLCHFSFLSFSIQHLEMNAERHWQELEDIFGPLNRRKWFHERMEPLITTYRHQNRGTQNHPYSHTPSPITTPSNPESHHPPSSDEPRPPHRPIVQKPWFQNVRFVRSPSMKLPTENTSYHTACEESTEIDPNNFLMQQPSNEKGPLIGWLQKTTPLGMQENPIDIDRLPSKKQQDTPSPTIRILYQTRLGPSRYTCLRCKRSGHTSQECIWSGPIICQQCGKSGHMKKDCKEQPLCSFCGGRHTKEGKPCDCPIGRPRLLP